MTGCFSSPSASASGRSTRRWRGELSGGALLDLHIHDVDFILSVFGRPNGVLARAVNGVDHIESSYLYDGIVCTAEGGWIMPGSFPFEMGYQVLGENGLLEFSLGKDPMLRFYPVDGEPYTPEFTPGTGYENELAYFVGCVEEGRAPERVTPESARDSVAMIMSEVQSIETGVRAGCGHHVLRTLRPHSAPPLRHCRQVEHPSVAHEQRDAVVSDHHPPHRAARRPDAHRLACGSHRRQPRRVTRDKQLLATVAGHVCR